jgi:hypothetical protein
MMKLQSLPRFALTYTGPAPRRAGHRPRTTTYAPNGKREVARRLRQIEAGQLRVTV